MYQVRAALTVAKTKDIKFDVASFNLLDSSVVGYFDVLFHFITAALF